MRKRKILFVFILLILASGMAIGIIDPKGNQTDQINNTDTITGTDVANATDTQSNITFVEKRTGAGGLYPESQESTTPEKTAEPVKSPGFEFIFLMVVFLILYISGIMKR